jgi:hypothetical protein
MHRFNEQKVRIFLILLSLFVGIVLCEGMVKLIRPASDIFPADPITDPILGIRLSPFQSGHDGKGFRNRSADGYFPIVCIGDSMIYGIGVPRRYAIPQQLSRLLHQRVYNMGLGSYGPVQYYQLLKESQGMHPQKTIIAFFLGNDLLDASGMVQKDYWKGLAQDIDDISLLQSITKCTIPIDDHTPEIFYQEPNLITIKLKKPGSYLWAVHSFMRLHSGLYALTYEGLVKPLIARVFERQVHYKRAGAFYSPSVDTVFMPRINLGAMDPQYPQVRQGLLVTKKIMEMIGRMLQGQNNQGSLLFFITPSKENVYYDYLTGRKVALPPQFECAVHYERQITRWLQQVITANGFKYVDVYPRMVEAANRGMMLYHATSDVHPNITGYGIIAQTLADAIRD